MQQIVIKGDQVQQDGQWMTAPGGDRGAMSYAFEHLGPDGGEIIVALPNDPAYVQPSCNLGYNRSGSKYAWHPQGFSGITLRGEDQAARIGAIWMQTDGGITISDLAMRDLTIDVTHTGANNRGQYAIFMAVNQNPLDGFTMDHVLLDLVSPKCKQGVLLHSPCRDLSVHGVHMVSGTGKGVGEHMFYLNDLLGAAIFDNVTGYRCRRTLAQVVSRIATNIGTTGDAALVFRNVLARECGEHSPFAITVAGGRHTVEIDGVTLEDCMGGGVNIYPDWKTFGYLSSGGGEKPPVSIPGYGQLQHGERVPFQDAVNLGLISSAGHCFDRVRVRHLRATGNQMSGTPLWIRSTRVSEIAPVDFAGSNKGAIRLGGGGTDWSNGREFLVGRSAPAGSWDWCPSTPKKVERWHPDLKGGQGGFAALADQEVDDLWRKNARP